MTMIESMAASRIARVVSRLSANCASAAIVSVRSRAMKTACGGRPPSTRGRDLGPRPPSSGRRRAARGSGCSRPRAEFSSNIFLRARSTAGRSSGCMSPKDAGAHGDVIVVSEEILSPRAVVGDHQVAVDDDDEVRRRGEDRLGHLDVGRQCGGARRCDGHVATGGIDRSTRVAATSTRSIGTNHRGTAADSRIRHAWRTNRPIRRRSPRSSRSTSSGWTKSMKALPVRSSGLQPSTRSHAGLVTTELPTDLVDREQVDGVSKVLTQVRIRLGFSRHLTSARLRAFDKCSVARDACAIPTAPQSLILGHTSKPIGWCWERR